MKLNISTLEALKFQGKDLEAMISRIDEEWEELKEVLLAGMHRTGWDDESSSQACRSCLTEAEKPPAADAPKADEIFLPPPQPEKFAINPTEGRAILDHVEKIKQENKTRERIGKLTRQRNRLSILVSILSIVTFVCMVQLYPGHVRNLWQTVQGLIPMAPSQAGTSRLTAAKPSKIPNPPVPAPANVTGKASGESQAMVGTTRDQNPPVPTPSTITAPPKEGASALTTNPQAPEAPVIKYVGSITSNKYHYPDCKWAKTIRPQKVRGFTSVAEAQKAGYIQCPTCQPPLADKPESPATNQVTPGGS